MAGAVCGARISVPTLGSKTHAPSSPPDSHLGCSDPRHGCVRHWRWRWRRHRRRSDHDWAGAELRADQSTDLPMGTSLEQRGPASSAIQESRQHEGVFHHRAKFVPLGLGTPPAAPPSPTVVHLDTPCLPARESHPSRLRHDDLRASAETSLRQRLEPLRAQRSRGSSTARASWVKVAPMSSPEQRSRTSPRSDVPYPDKQRAP